MSLLTILSYVAILLLIAVLAFFLYWIGSLLTTIADNLGEANDHVRAIIADAERIKPGIDHINHTGGVVAGALPLLYGHAERISGEKLPIEATARHAHGNGPVRAGGGGASSASRRRSRLMETVGFRRE